MRAIFFIILVAINSTYSKEIKCHFMQHSDGYNCHMESELQEPTEATSINGSHRDNKDNSLVEVVFVSSSVFTSYLPSHLCNFFQNLYEYESYADKLLEISRSVFTNCTNLNLLMIKRAKFSEIPDDALLDLPNLTILEIVNTRLSYLQENLFANNQKLLTVDLSSNQLKVEFFS
jgi:Leucine-rich repeat (LRR) protein